MIHSAALPVAETADLANRKKHRELQTAVRKATMFLTGQPKKQNEITKI